MLAKYLVAAAFAIGMSLTSAAAWAAASDYAFEPVAAELKKGDDVVIAVRMLHKPTGKPVADAVIVRARVDMAPDGMADMPSPVAAVPGNEPGVYAFKTDLPMAGALSAQSRRQGARRAGDGHRQGHFQSGQVNRPLDAVSGGRASTTMSPGLRLGPRICST